MKKNTAHYVWRSTLLVLALMLTFTSCNKTKKKHIKIDRGFTNYITGFTSGIISNSDAIVIELSDAQKKEIADEDLTKLFSFTPSIEGVATFTNDFTITFKPKQVT